MRTDKTNRTNRKQVTRPMKAMFGVSCLLLVVLGVLGYKLAQRPGPTEWQTKIDGHTVLVLSWPDSNFGIIDVDPNPVQVRAHIDTSAPTIGLSSLSIVTKKWYGRSVTTVGRKCDVAPVTLRGPDLPAGRVDAAVDIVSRAFAQWRIAHDAHELHEGPSA